MTFFYDLNKKLAGLAGKTQLNESAKPDFLDVDKDGNKKEAFKKAVKDKETGKVDEAGYSAKAARAGKDIGKPGKQFAKIAKSAGEKYGSKERGEKVAGAVLAKLRGKTTEGEIPPEFQKPKKVDVPAYQRKAQGGDWKTTQADLDKDRERNISDRKGLARLRGANPADIDEGWDDMLKDVAKRSGEMRTGEKRKTAKGEIEKTATGIRHTRSYDEKTGETDTGDDTPAGEKRGRGRPKKYTDDKPRQERVTAKSRKADRTAYTKKKKVGEDYGPMESEHDDEVQTALRLLKKAGYKVTKDGEEELDEKAVSKAQQKFMGMVHATQKGEKAPSKEVAKVAKSMKKSDAEDFAATKHKGLPEKAPKKKEKTEESGTTAGSVATAPASGGGKGGFQFGKGIYDSMNRELENMISESMNISMNISNNPEGGPSQSLTVTATDEDAVKLSALLKMAGVGGHGEEDHSACPTCGESPCGCAEKVDENSPDWPTDEVEAESNLEYSGGLNGPKSTGQTTVPVIAGQEDRMGADGEDDPLKRIREMAGIAEAKAKPDYIDLDKDGDKKEPMKKAAKDKEEKKVEESILGLTNLWKEYKAQ